MHTSSESVSTKGHSAAFCVMAEVCVSCNTFPRKRAHHDRVHFHDVGFEVEGLEFRVEEPTCWEPKIFHEAATTASTFMR